MSLMQQFQSLSMKDREGRLKVARRDSERCVRELKRDRTELERKEKQLMLNLRHQLKVGDLPKAQMIAKQLQCFRNISDKNFERSIYIQTQAQIRFSNHKINQATIESLKGLRFANKRETFDTVTKRDKKYKYEKNIQEAMENIMNESFEEVFEELDEESGTRVYGDAQLEAIYKEALDPKLTVRDYIMNQNDPLDKSGEADTLEAGITIPTTEVSSDMLKRLIFNDKAVVRQLGLNRGQPIQLGTVALEGNDRCFVAFSAADSLKDQGIDNDSVVWVHYLVVGGTQGIGKATAISLGSLGASVSVVGRNKDRGNQVVSELQSKSASTQSFQFYSLDVTSISKVKQFCQDFKNRNAKLDGMVLCAGGLNFGPRRVTSESLELTFAMNYLSRFSLIKNLIDILEKGNGRVVNCLGAGNGTAIDADDLQLEKESYVPFFIRAASQHATMTDITTREFASRYPKVLNYHLFPGIVNTNGLANQGFPQVLTYLQGMFGWIVAQDPKNVGELITYILTSDEFGKSENNGGLVSPSGSLMKPNKFIVEGGKELGSKIFDYADNLETEL
ncbi:hypothetical protein HK103_005153 [Boothiomyces macroporosus]|uniref:Uncharacterized protein n=1 Tax=Boothiomyces macroporosus TaxID=261099 RepID=A0AAD5Y7Z1_9FUNG|nr:hypothetical protein HK103_005153 [Boothiomyces macroporosus]